MFTSARIYTDPGHPPRAGLVDGRLPRLYDFRGLMRRPVPGLRPAH